MDPRLLRLYNEELAYLREMGAEFSHNFPKIAGRLGLTRGERADPMVERMLEGVAFLAARVQLKLQARFPDFTQHLLQIVYPHFLAPLPAMGIAEFTPDPQAGRLEKGYLIPRGTVLTGALAAGTTTHCQYKTAHDVHIWPLRVASVDYYDAPSQISSLALPTEQTVKAVLRLRLETTNGIALNKLSLRRLVLHFKGAGGIGGALAEHVLADPVIVITRPAQKPADWEEILDPDSVRQYGLHASQSLLPDVPRSFDGYRLLQEYFALPERACFIEVDGLSDSIRESSTNEIEILFASKRVDERLRRALGPTNVSLFASPFVNLFERNADRFYVSDRHHEHHVVVDRLRPLDFELHSVLSLKGQAGEGRSETINYQPLYSLNDSTSRNESGSYYTLRRERRLVPPSHQHSGTRTGYIGSEVFITTVEGASTAGAERQLQLSCLCTNRDLPISMPLGEGRSDFTLEIGAPIESVRCVSGPTRPRPSAAEGDTAWELISHLSLNYLSITDCGDEDRGTVGLRELLRLYCDDTDDVCSRQIDAITRVTSQPIVRRLPGAAYGAIVRGIEITIEIDETGFEGVGCFPFATVLDKFFAQYVSINSFTETVLTSLQRGVLMRWEIAKGRRPIL
ncbi:type VI secretion system baseplate subunit TssF [Ensifer adhaerens]|uniref:type VI secretion system baseplate subunit TssF n=1 Tax=Ensifer adhaerens TaxID=106592 RepID=UPI003850994E